MIISGCYLLIEAWGKRVRIDTKGVQYKGFYKKYRIEWKDIKNISIRGFVCRTRVDAICFFTEQSLYSDISPKNIGNDFVMMLNVNKRAIQQISSYWDGEIGGLEYFNY
ncbi:PH domain-containing protein [Herbivorax sp. ANBcel31]|uniref:PH domain-containing protein n=1 Tax=Herbivorax sp. ANBcel31 TaxID=3069754 RepID=UPI0027B5DBE4|nr:PH domain-containing protein [Herbivorax sp. ANBcel31]MDQ2087961.1 PH domain-containing protein [Herbivorax sp. ANBcel31]